MNIRTLTIKDITKISTVLAYRHKEERLVYPSLNERFEHVDVLEKIVKKKFEDKLMIAIGAFENERLLGFIMSTIRTEKTFGRCAWVAYDGLALAEGVDSEIYRDLYTDIADRWLSLGCLKHFVILPAAKEEVMKAWLNSSFAYEQVFGLQSLKSSDVKAIEDVHIRKATPDDKVDLQSLSSIILSYQAQSPTFAAALPESFAEFKEGYGGLVSDEDAHILLAYKGEDLLGFTCGYLDEDSGQNMMLPVKSTELGVAATNPKFQCKGVGTLLTQSLFRDLLTAGFENTTTDWRICNRKSSVFWPKMGYVPYAYRMVRNIDERVLWANGKNRI